MIFEGVTSWIHALTKPKEKPPEPVAQGYNPDYRRYSHLKTEAGEWKNQENEPFPHLAVSAKARERREIADYREASDQVAFVEDMMGRRVSGYNPASSWNHAWAVVDQLPFRHARELKDRLLACHPSWEKLETDLERIRSLRAETGRSERMQSLEREMDGMERWLQEEESDKSLPAALTKSKAKLAWFEHRLNEERAVADSLDARQEVRPRGIAPALSEDNARGVLLHSMQRPILETVAEAKSTRLKREMARSDQKAVKSELQTITFQLERELGATRPHAQVNEIMAAIRQGAFKVGVVSRVRDWFSGALGRIAGHAEAPNLHDLVEKHRLLYQKLAKIEAVLEETRPDSTSRA